jgi:hypothetical protein
LSLEHAVGPGSALDEFRHEIQEFVNDNDQNLSQAAGHILNVASELDEMLGDAKLARG